MVNVNAQVAKMQSMHEVFMKAFQINHTLYDMANNPMNKTFTIGLFSDIRICIALQKFIPKFEYALRYGLCTC